MKISIFILLLGAFMNEAMVAQLVTLRQVDLTVNSGATVSIDGSVEAQGAASVTNNGTIALSGDLINDSGSDLFGTSEGTVEMRGANQLIGGADPIQFNHLQLVNGGTVTLDNATSTGGAYASPAGVLSLGSKKLLLNVHRLTVTNPLPAAITRTTGYIVSETDVNAGYSEVEWEIGNAASGTYTWPFGNDVTDDYLPVVIHLTAAGMGQGNFSIATYPTDPFQNPNNRPLPLGLTTMQDIMGNENAQNVVDRFWIIHTNNYLVDPEGDLTLTYRDSEANTGNNVFNENLLQSQFQDGLVWSQPPSGIVDPVNNFVFTPSVSNWNYNWVLVASNMLLPISLVDFDAQPIDNERVNCMWTTVSEINNNYFTIERSLDAEVFDVVGEVEGAGTSTIARNYSFTDNSPYTGWSYYRLGQTDFSGNRVWSETRAVYIGNSQEWGISVFPNPVQSNLTIHLSGSDEVVLCELRDATGRRVDRFQHVGGGPIVRDFSFIAAGTYILSVSDSTHREIVTIVKQ